jgi:L-arabinose isomerase
MKPLERFDVWFVTGSQDLYGEETLARVEVDAGEIASALDAASEIPLRVIPKPVVKSPDSILRLLEEASASPSCAGVICWMHTFSPAKMWIAGLNALRKPLLHLHTQFNRELPAAEIDMGFMNLNQSAHGDREFGFLETRMRVARKTVVGHWSDPRVLARIGHWARAAAGWQEAQSLQVCRFGDNMRQVAVTEGDKVEAQIRLGVSVNGYGVSELGRAVALAEPEELARLLADYEERYRLAPELLEGGERRQALVEAARLEAGLRSFLQEGGFGAFTDSFEDLGELEQLPGLAAQRLMAEGYGFGAEGDWKTAALVRILKLMATGLAGGTSFMEDYTYDLTPGSETVLGAHMLEVCPSLAAQRPSLELHPLAIGGRADPARLVFTAAPGPALLVSLIDLGERFRLIVNEVELVEPAQELPRLPVARALWKPRPDFASAAEAWLIAGGAHHSVLTQQLTLEHLVDLARIAGIELVVIDEHTRPERLEQELRWSQAYYHLARGL